MSATRSRVIDLPASAVSSRTPDEDLLHRSIEKARAESQRVIEYVQNNVPQDRLLKATAVRFEGGKDLRMVGGTLNDPLTHHALAQACLRVGFPSGYAGEAIEGRRNGSSTSYDVPGDLGREVVAQALSTLWKADTRKVLARSVNGMVHGVMSDAYRRLDCRPGLDAFIGEVQRFGAIPYGGMVTETRIAIKAVLPRIIRLGTNSWNDAVIIGVVLRNSDFGAGKYSLALYLERVRCLNGMIAETLFAQRHVGSRLEDEDFWSERTHKLDSATMISATRDNVKLLLSPAGVEKTTAALQAAATNVLDTKEIDAALKKALTKEELKSVTGALQSIDEDEMPLGPLTSYRMANAVSWLAGQTEDGDRKLDLQKLAGTYLKAA